MSKVSVLVEVAAEQDAAFTKHMESFSSVAETFEAAERVVERVPKMLGLGVDVVDNFPPVPLFDEKKIHERVANFASFGEAEDMRASTVVVACEVDRARLADLEKVKGVTIYPNSELSLFCQCQAGARLDGASDLTVFDLATSAGGIDCRPFRPAVDIPTIRALLGAERVWRDGFRGQNVGVAIIDEGVDGRVYPVVGGFSRPGAQQPGTAPITSHGSMCAADVLVAAPSAKLYDYPFLGIPNSGGALQMFQAVLNERRTTGLPQVANNSYGFVAVPPPSSSPNHEIWDLNHPLHRKVREVVASGAVVLFAAGNCGQQCPSSVCHPSSVGPAKSIHGSNSLAEVITVAAVNSRHERIGYSSQGPGMFEGQKPDVSGYSHFFGNFGPGRPANGTGFDNGTSAATPVVAGVVAVLLSAFPNLTPALVKQALEQTAFNIGRPGWDPDTGWGVVNLAAAYASLRQPAPPAGGVGAMARVSNGVGNGAADDSNAGAVIPRPRARPKSPSKKTAPGRKRRAAAAR